MNAYCEALGIAVPSVEKAAQSRDACSYGLLIAVLLERGGPITLEEAARRIAAAGVGDEGSVLDSLKRCRPGRPPIYRTGDQYALDPHDDEAGLWAFRLGLKPPKVSPMRVAEPRAEHVPLPGPEVPLTLEELGEAWRRYVPAGFSQQRLTVSVLDAHRRPMKPEEVVAYVQARTTWRSLSVNAAQHWGQNAPVRVRDDGLWELQPDHEAVRSARRAVRALVATERRSNQPSREEAEAAYRRLDEEREARAEEMERLRRVLIYGFPAERPEAVVLIDINRHQIETLAGPRVSRTGERLLNYDVIVGLEVRNLLQAIGFDPGQRRLAELGAPQKSRQLNRRGRTLRITTELLIQGSCRISRPFGNRTKTLAYLREGQETKFRRRVEADAKSLLAFHQYGRLHHCVRLRWGFIDETLPAPWVYRDERGLYDLMRRASELDVPLEIVVGSPPGWEEPWSRARRVRVIKEPGGWRYLLSDEDGGYVDEPEIQAARLVDPRKEKRPCDDHPAEARQSRLSGSAVVSDAARLFTLDVFIVSGPVTKAFARENKLVSRTIQICGDQTLAELHQAIFKAFDRKEEHMYEFQVGGKGPMDPEARKYGCAMAGQPFADEKPTGNAVQTTVGSIGLKAGDAFGYWFDFGDDWWHQINVKAVEDKVPRGKYPRVTKRVGQSPPQYADLETE